MIRRLSQEDLQERWVHVTSMLNDLVVRLTHELPMSVDDAHLAVVCDGIVEVLRDRDPDDTLRRFAKSPLPVVKGRYFENFISPLQAWHRLERWARFWPESVQKSAKQLGVGSGRLPEWKTIERFFKKQGFTVVPVLGYIDVPVYSYLISKKMIPFSTLWALHMKEPVLSLRAPVDPFHDIGHALALTQQDYRVLIVRFSKAFLRSRRFIAAERNANLYGKYFELNFAYDPRNPGRRAEPIGAIMMTFDPFIRKGLPLIHMDPEFLAQVNKAGHFRSRDAWVEETEKVIATITRAGRRSASSGGRTS